MLSIPSWLDSLQPTQRPTLRPLLGSSPELAWHVGVDFVPWRVPAGLALTGSQTWNGKSLIAPSNPSLDASVGEVEVAERLRNAFPTRFAYWTAGSGHPPRQWRDWALTPAVREQEPWLVELDRKIRDADDALRDNHRGWPDVLSWESGAHDLFCVEYKGPFPSNPDVLDTVSFEQHAWFLAAVRQRLLDPDRYAVVTWVPSAAAKVILREQWSARQSRHAVLEASRGTRLGPRRAPPSMQVVEAAGGPQGQQTGLRQLAHGDEKLHRRTIRSVLKQRTGAAVVSHIDGTIDVEIHHPGPRRRSVTWSWRKSHVSAIHPPRRWSRPGGQAVGASASPLGKHSRSGVAARSARARDAHRSRGSGTWRG